MSWKCASSCFFHSSLFFFINSKSSPICTSCFLSIYDLCLSCSTVDFSLITLKRNLYTLNSNQSSQNSNHYTSLIRLSHRSMKKRVLKAPQPHKILQQQSSKLKEKIQLLKQQIQQKKKEKESGKNQLGESSASKSKANLDTVMQQNSLLQLLAGLQMQHLLNKLKQKNINTLDQFRSMTPQTIDHWKEIPVGYRIKLKKNLSNLLKNSPTPSPQKNNSLTPSKQIEDIIQGRKKDKLYVPLNRLEEGDYGQLSEHQQQQMIESLMRAFNPSQQIEQVKLQMKDKPQVVVQSKEAWGTNQKYPEYIYCWTCLKMITNALTYKDRSFCSQNCTQNYKLAIEVEQNTQFFHTIAKTENIFTKYLQNRSKSKVQSKRPNRNIDDQDQIDLQIV